jgi:hypothetical protein
VLLAHDREFSLSLVFVQLFASHGGVESGAFMPESDRQLDDGSNIAGMELNGSGALLVGLLPDGVARVDVDYEPHVSFTAAVRNNIFLHRIPDRFPVGSGDPPERETWLGEHGTVLRTITSKSDGTIIIDRPGHRQEIIPGD